MIRVLWDVTLCGWVSHEVSNERSAFIFNRNVENYARKTASCSKRPDSTDFISPRRPDRVICQHNLLSNGGAILEIAKMTMSL
jgi:hypothetical protein